LARKKLTKKQRRNRIKIAVSTLVLILVFGLGVLFERSSYSISNLYTNISQTVTQFVEGLKQPTPQVKADSAQVHIFDVGQGSAALYQSSDGTNILIDTGRHDDDEQKIISYLDEHLGIGNAIDLLIFSHNHADHIGNSDLIFDYFDVEEVWMNGLDATSAVYEDTLDAIADSGADYYEPNAGDTTETGPFSIEVLHPEEGSSNEDQNDESIITRITVNDLSIMTSGDATYNVEDEVIQNNGQLNSDILVIGHHGSKESTGRNWLNAVNPELAVYSAGRSNSYGHPHNQVIDRVEDVGVPLYGTDKNGTVSFYIDENGSYEVEMDQE